MYKFQEQDYILEVIRKDGLFLATIAQYGQVLESSSYTRFGQAMDAISEYTYKYITKGE